MSDMRRREFISLLGGAAVAWPLAARAQTNPMKRLAVLMGISKDNPESKARLTALGEGLEGVGWKEGQNLHIEYRYAAGDLNRIRSYAAEIVRMSPDVILVNSAQALAALREETRTIPIVFAQVADPVVAGLVASLAYPGGNITGFTQFEPSVGEKWLETLKEIAPGITRAAVLGNSQNPNWSASIAAIRKVAPSLSVVLTPVDVTDVSGIEAEIKSFANEANGGLVVLTDINNTVNRDIIIAMALRYRLPAIYPYRFWVESGGLISYGIDNLDSLSACGILR